jgi:hypothetical protein
MAGEVRRAHVDYVALVRAGGSGTRCALRGLKALSDEAATARKSKAGAARRALAAQTKALCDRGDMMRAAGEWSEAVSAYTGALEKTPGTSCVKNGLEAGPPVTIRSRLGDVASALPDVLVLLGLGFVGLFLLLLLGHAPRVFDKMIHMPVLGTMLAPKLTVNPIDDQSGQEVGKTLDARINKHLSEMRRLASAEAGPAYELDFSTPDEDFADLVAGDSGLSSALDKASEGSDHLKIVGAVLTLIYTLLPTQRLAVSGVLEPEVDRRASLTLSLADGGRPVAAHTVHGSSAADTEKIGAADFIKLAAPAAVWAQYEVARVVGGVTDRGPEAATAYALVREGIDEALAGDELAARVKFVQARDLDASNWAASLNLAMTEARLANDYTRAAEILDGAFQRIQQV